MRTTVFAVLALLTAMTAAAGKIELVDPSSIAAGGSEQFINIYGTDLGDHVLFSGKAGEFDLEISARTERGIVAYVPDEMLNAPGRYTIYVRGELGVSGPAYLDVLVSQSKQPLVLLVPDPIAEPASSRSGAVVRYEVWPYGGSDPRPSVSCTTASGAVFPLGPTNVTCVATNSFGEHAEGQVSITVYDGAAPILKLPERVSVFAESVNGATVKFDASAFDEIDGELRVTCAPESGSIFPIGKTTVDCSATDSAFNVAQGSFTVEVQNRGFLILHLPGQVVAEAESKDGAFVKFEAWADGTEDPRPVVKCDPQSGSLFAMGATSVLCVASDKFGASAQGKFEVDVVDTAPPVFMKLYARPDLLSNTGELTSVSVGWDVVDVVDPLPRCGIVTVWSNDPITENDYKIVSENEIALRGATSGSVDRVYHVNVLCTDSSLNSSGGNVDVTVPAGKGQDATTPTPGAPTKRRSSRH
jgi:hypothetical protein